MSTSSALASFEESAYAACCAQFPRACQACRRPHPTFLSYIEATRLIGAPRLDPDDDEEDAIGLLSFANCPCGSTLAVRYEDVSRHAAFNAAVRTAVSATGRPAAELLQDLVRAVHARARSASTAGPRRLGAPDQRSLDVGAAMMAILRRGSVQVPPLPAVAFKVVDLARSPDSTPEQIATAISSDAALAVELLHLVNAPHYARGTPVSSLSMAVKRLGMREVARLALATGVGGATAKAGPLSGVRLHLWHRSVTTATVARALGALRGLPPDESFLAGLLQPLGSIVGTLSLEVFLASDPSFAPQPLSFWLRVLELFRAELGALTATRWKLPGALAEVIAFQLGADSTGCQSPAMIDLVAASAQVARIATEVDEITDAALSQAPGLSAAERAELVRTLPHLAEGMAALQDVTTPGAAGAHVLPAPAPAPAAPLAQELLAVNRRRREERFRVVSFAPRALVLDGTAALPEQVLATLELQTEPPLSVCGVTSSCSAGGAAHRLVLTPFALSADAARLLRQLRT